jgi:hypothetical protein
VPGVRLVDVAEIAGVSVGTVSAALNRPETLPAMTLATVTAALAQTGYVRGAPPADLAAHWRRNNFAGRVFQPAVTGRFVKKAPGAQAVVVTADPFPGIPVRGRGAVNRADACWTPLGLLGDARREHDGVCRRDDQSVVFPLMLSFCRSRCRGPDGRVTGMNGVRDEQR